MTTQPQRNNNEGYRNKEPYKWKMYRIQHRWSPLKVIFFNAASPLENYFILSDPFNPHLGYYRSSSHMPKLPELRLSHLSL